ncbi:hypothetical protein C8Q73DRAFT_661583 [Cubamyces lactineus]|nr:hypothetical protein C8Q73DRAFT_661583 [Cubamyces lactineus]
MAVQGPTLISRARRSRGRGERDAESKSERQGEYHYNSSEVITSALFHAFGPSETALLIDVCAIVGNRNMILNENVYAQVRETIREKVSQNSQHLMSEIQLLLL